MDITRKDSRSVIPGLRKFVDKVARVTAEKAAEKIVTDLKKAGPYYSGEFKENWVVLPGDQPVTADKESSFTAREKWQGWESETFPFNRRVTPVEIPRLPVANYRLTIGNRMDYRDYAMDLKPGRFEVDKNNTADKDWFLRYVQAGGMQQALREATADASRDPRLRNQR